MCVFCDIASNKIKANIVYEDEKVISFLDNDPINEGHVLLIPKTHYLDADELPTDLLKHLTGISQKLVAAIKRAYHPDGYSIMQNGGEFNDIGHYHLHIFPRYKNDGFSWKSSDIEYSHSQEVANKIRNAM